MLTLVNFQLSRAINFQGAMPTCRFWLDYSWRSQTLVPTLNLQAEISGLAASTHNVVSTPSSGAIHGLRGLSPRKCRYSHDRETDWSRIRASKIPHLRICIVSAVKICKQCLQTASASGDTPDQNPLPWLRSWTPLVPISPGPQPPSE